ncbi:MAG: hypothetical protein H6822_01140 [Planctomycetaceae bacterium]|nr:hypothetical protein [Planctomycetales bacterium]MCB9920751.1 hypothetical protein [Planctomycetaceae bacterium]
MNRDRLVIIITITVAFLWCFGSVLFQDRSFGFRDAANYYYPLFEWECGEWRSGGVPLWNPLDNGGTPVLADATSSVLYPGKVIFALPVSYRLRYHIYVTAHVLLAAGMAYCLARHWQGSVQASGLAAISYAFGGNVLFQYCNVVFLIGAAWLPLGLLAADRMLRERSLGWAIMLGATLALMVLGGDPQAAYHAGAMAALYAVLVTRQSEAEKAHKPVTWLSSRPTLLGVAAIAGIALSLVQILPSVEWTNRSNRRYSDTPRNIYEMFHSIEEASSPDEFIKDVKTGIFASPQPGTHLRHVYEFSIGPWRLIEFVWPNIFGRLFPRNERWSTAFPGESRIWTPSLYVGLLPFILAVLTWRTRRCDSRIRFASLLAVITLLASFGWYGIGWIIYELSESLSGQAPEQLVIGEPVGGLYWLFVTLLPSYVYFRYPAKLLVITSLCISLLAARGWDDFVHAKSRRLSVALVVVVSISLAMAAGFGFYQEQWKSRLATAAPDTVFGPLDIAAATHCVLFALLQAAVLGLAYWFLLRASHGRFVPTQSISILLVTGLELCVANGWMTLSIPGDIWREQRPLIESIKQSDDRETPLRMFRDSTAKLLPNDWSETTAASRLADVVSWERATLLPKHHLQSGLAIIGSHTTLTSADWQSFLRVFRAFDTSHTKGQQASLLDLMSVERNAVSTKNAIELDTNPRAFPRAWIVREIEIIPPLADRGSSEALDQRTREVFLEDGRKIRDLRSIAVIESDDLQSLQRFPNSSKSYIQDSCEITHYSARRVDIEASLAAPGCLVLNDSFYPGWNAVCETKGVSTDVPIYRANRLMRAVMLPAGEHHIVFAYQPVTFKIGVWISGLAWLITSGFAVRSLWLRQSTGRTVR